MKYRFTIVFIAISLLWACAESQKTSENQDPSTSADCLGAKAVKAADLYGDWKARIEGSAAEATVTFEAHKETEGALSGRIVRPSGSGAAQAPTTSVLAGGVGDGQFGIEESDDGRRISGLWNGDVVPNSCGREIRGTWIDPADDSERGFVLRRGARRW
ncbi:MAG: hypothetical protein ABI589_12295 [Burkholderiales bacterium]